MIQLAGDQVSRMMVDVLRMESPEVAPGSPAPAQATLLPHGEPQLSVGQSKRRRCFSDFVSSPSCHFAQMAKHRKKKGPPHKGIARTSKSSSYASSPIRIPEFSLKDEIFNTKHNAWTSNSKLRYKTISFVSAGHLHGSEWDRASSSGEDAADEAEEEVGSGEHEDDDDEDDVQLHARFERNSHNVAKPSLSNSSVVPEGKPLICRFSAFTSIASYHSTASLVCANTSNN